MAKVEYSFPVEKIHGKIAKSHKIGFAHRAASNLNYTQAYTKRNLFNHPYTEAEQLHKIKFATVVQATHNRMADTEQLLIDQAAFKAQSKYKSLYQYVFNQEWQAYQG